MTLTETERILLYVAYLIGFTAAFYAGMKYQQWRLKKYIDIKIEIAYDRGWKAGYEFVGTIASRRVDMDSAVRVLTGEDADGDRPFPRS